MTKIPSLRVVREEEPTGRSVKICSPNGVVAIVKAHGKKLGIERQLAAGPEAIALLKELTDIEGPQPGHVTWYNKVIAFLAKVEG